MPICKKGAALLLLAGLAVLAIPGAVMLRSTTLARMDVEELTKTATLVARARCLSIASRWEDGLLWTFTTFVVTETWKGPAPQTLTVRLVGGRVGERRVIVEGVPRFVPGEEVVLFLEPGGKGDWTVTSWAQGTFRVRPATAGETQVLTQDTGGMALFDAATRRFRAGGVRNMPVEELRRRVLAASRARGRVQ